MAARLKKAVEHWLHSELAESQAQTLKLEPTEEKKYEKEMKIILCGAGIVHEPTAADHHQSV